MATSQHRDGGDTLIEMLLVTMILGLLAAVVLFSVRGRSDESRAATCDAEARSLVAAAETYFETTKATIIVGTGLGDDRYELTLARQGLLREPSTHFDLTPHGLLTPSGSRCS